MTTFIKKYRIYELRTNGQVLPVLSKDLNDTANWFEDENQAVNALSLLNPEPFDNYIILPIYYTTLP